MTTSRPGLYASEARLTGCRLPARARSITSRSPYSEFGPALKLPWTRLEAPELAQELRDRLIAGADLVAGGRDYTELNRERDLGLVAISKALKAISE